MALLPSFADAGWSPMHAGHEGGGTFDSYNLTVGGVVLVVLVVLGYVVFRLVKRRRGLD